MGDKFLKYIFLFLISGSFLFSQVRNELVSADSLTEKGEYYYKLANSIYVKGRSGIIVSADSLELKQRYLDSSNYYYLQSTEILKKNKAWEKFIDISYKISINFNRLDKRYSAIANLALALDLIEKNNGLTKDLSVYYYKLSALYYNFQKYENAIGYILYYLYLNSELPIDVMTLNAYKHASNCYGAIHDFDNAIKYSKLILENSAGIKNQNTSFIAKEYSRLAELYQLKQDHTNTEFYINKSIELAEKANNPIQLLYFKEKQVDFLKKNGKMKEAILLTDSIIQKKIELFDDSHRILATSYIKQSYAYKDIGDYYNSLLYLQKAISIKEKYEIDRQALVKEYYDLAEIYYYLKDFKNVRKYSNLALQLAEGKKVENKNVLSDLYILISKLNIHEKKYSEAFDALSKNIELLTLFDDNKYFLSANYYQIAQIYLLLNSYDNAELYFDLALETAKENEYSNNSFFIKIFSNFSDLYRKRKNFELALKYAEKSITENINDDFKIEDSKIELFDNVLLKDFLLKDIVNIAQIFSSKNGDEINNRIIANKYFETSIKIYDELRLNFKTNDSKFLLAGNFTNIIENAIENAHRLYVLTKDFTYAEKAFMYSEKNKINILYDDIVENKAKENSDIPDSLLTLERELKKEIQELNTLIENQIQNQSYDENVIQNLRNNLFLKKQNYSSLILNLEQDYKSYSSVKYKVREIELSKIQNNIKKGSIVLEYFTGEKAIYIFAICKLEINFHKVDVNKDSYEKVKDFHRELSKGINLIRNNNRKKFISLSNQLYNLLLKPVENQIRGKKTMIIIPSGELFYLPFESLISKSVKSNLFSAQNFIINDFNISYSFAGEFIDEFNLNDLEDYENSFLGFAPAFQDAGNSIFSDYQALKYSADEVKNIGNMFLAKGLASKTYIGKAASEKNFINEINKNKFYAVHIATHGIINEINPDYSSLVFANESNYSIPSFLYSKELFDIKFKSNLVVLSACESGLGKVARGEGILALTRGLIYSAVPNIIYSLWKVNDRSTRNFMARFYQHLLNRDQIDSALRKVKIEMLKNEIDSNPADWASFILLQ